MKIYTFNVVVYEDTFQVKVRANNLDHATLLLNLLVDDSLPYVSLLVSVE